jgi:hypothetical protein
MGRGGVGIVQHCGWWIGTEVRTMSNPAFDAFMTGMAVGAFFGAALALVLVRIAGGLHWEDRQ